MHTTVSLEVTLDMGSRCHPAAAADSLDFGPKIKEALMAAVPEIAEIEWGGIYQVRRIPDLEAEVARLKEVIAAKPAEDGKTLRVQMSTTPEGKPCLIVTAPIHFEEERLAQEIATLMNLWVGVAESLADDKAAGKIRAEIVAALPGLESIALAACHNACGEVGQTTWPFDAVNKLRRAVGLKPLQPPRK